MGVQDVSLQIHRHQMMTSDDYAATSWPESGTKRYPREVLSIPQHLASVAHQMEQLLNLKENWNSYGAHRISRDSVASAMYVLTAYNTGIPVPDVFPTAKGGVKLEWGDDSESVELEFQPEGAIAILIDESGEMRESVVRDLNDPAVFDALNWAEKLS